MVHAPHTERAPPTRLPRPTPRFAGMLPLHRGVWAGGITRQLGRGVPRGSVSTQVASLRRRQPCSDKAFARGVGLSSASEKREKARRTNHNMHMHMSQVHAHVLCMHMCMHMCMLSTHATVFFRPDVPVSKTTSNLQPLPPPAPVCRRIDLSCLCGEAHKPTPSVLGQHSQSGCKRPHAETEGP